MILRSMTPRPVLLAARRTAASAGSAVIGSSRSLQPTTGSQRNIHNVTIHSETGILKPKTGELLLMGAVCVHTIEKGSGRERNTQRRPKQQRKSGSWLSL